MQNRRRVIYGVLTFFGAAMGLGYCWIFAAIAPPPPINISPPPHVVPPPNVGGDTAPELTTSTVHGFVRFPKDPWRLERRQEMEVVKTRSALLSALKKDGIRDFAIVKKQRDPIEWLERALVVEFPRDGNVMRISLTGSNSHELAEIVNAVLDAYDEGLAAKEKSDLDRIAAIEKSNEALEAFDIERAEREFRQGMIPMQRIADRETARRLKVERFRRHDVSIQRATSP